ncbi:MAG TPA: hypothetical protein GXX28_01695 [Firmicutes bacterium]|nr:hypothetical protein [Bacillota bacterium]
MSYTHPLSILLAILLALAFVGRPAPADQSTQSPPGEATATGQTPPQGAPPLTVEHPEAVLTLPSGDVLTAADREPFRGSNLTLRLETLSVNASRSDWWAEAVGNHAELLKVEQVALPVGEAILALAKRTLPAAAQSPQAATEYWLMVSRPEREEKDRKTVYAVVAQVTGDPGAARKELLRLAQQWEVPERAEAR